MSFARGNRGAIGNTPWRCPVRILCALTRRHELWCWGENYARQVVPDSEATLIFHPVRMNVPNL